MQPRKSNSIKLKQFFYSILGLTILFLLCSLLLYFLQSRKDNSKLKITLPIKAPNCNYAEIFFNSDRKISLETQNYIKIPLDKNLFAKKYSVELPSPIYYFRFDPCDELHKVELGSIEVKYNNNFVSIVPEQIARWNCENCVLNQTADGLEIKALTNDPMLITNSFDMEIQALHIPENNFKFSKFFYIIFFLMFLPIFYVVFLKLKFLFIEAGIYYFIILIIIKINIEKIRNIFPPVRIGVNKVIGFVHFIGYPIMFDSFIFFLIIAIPILVQVMLFIRKKLIK